MKDILDEMERLVPMIEERYPGNPWPRRAANSMKEYVLNQSEENLNRANGEYRKCAPLFYEAGAGWLKSDK